MPNIDLKLRIIFFLTTLNLLMFNPLVLQYAYQPLDETLQTLVWAIFLIIFFLTLAVYFHHNQWYRRKVLHFSISMFAILLLIFLLRMVDHVIGLANKDELIFPSNTSVLYETSEYKFTSEVNSLGFRDQEVKTNNRETFRILAIGDSYTYGWGVSIEESWVKIAEKKLRLKGKQVAIMNLGKGGTFSKDYVDIARKATPVLKPDLIIIGLLQANDLYYAIEHASPKRNRFFEKFRQSDLKAISELMLKTIIPNIYNSILFDTHDHEMNVNEVWAAQSQRLLNLIENNADSSNSGIDPTIVQLAREGYLNPAIIARTLFHGDMYSILSDTLNQRFAAGVQQVVNDLTEIRRIADAYGTKVIVFSIPTKLYTSPEARIFESDNLGMQLKEGAVINTSDRAFETASGLAEIQFFEFTHDMIKACDSIQLYYKIDGHFNIQGNEIFGNLASEKLVDFIH